MQIKKATIIATPLDGSHDRQGKLASYAYVCMYGQKQGRAAKASVGSFEPISFPSDTTCFALAGKLGVSKSMRAL